MNRTEIVLAAVGIISIIALGGVSIAYSNAMATQQTNTNLLLYYYFGIPPEPYGITFIVTNNTDSKNPVTTTMKLTWSNLLTLPNTTFPSGSGSPENGPSLNNITYNFFSLNLTNVSISSIIVLGAEGKSLVYGVEPWGLTELNNLWPILDYAEGTGGGGHLWKGTCKFCAPNGELGFPDWIPKPDYVKAVNTIWITFVET